MEPTFRLAEHSDVDRLIVYMRQLYVHDGTPFDEPAARRALDGVVRDRSLGRVWMIGDGRDTVGYVVLTLGYSL
ncbi:MAG: GNAT family N-acetyltransferase, partial [Acidobacteria bacterium]